MPRLLSLPRPLSRATEFQSDLDVVERQLHVLADSWVRMEAEHLHITCEEMFLRRQASLGRNTGKRPMLPTTALSCTFLPSWRQRVLSCKVTQRQHMHVHLSMTLYLITFRIITGSVVACQSAGATRSRPCCSYSSSTRLSLLVDQTRVWWSFHVRVLF